MAKYDVFISCKSEDYKYAETIYDFLTEHGINTFLASKELRIMGDSEYRRAIAKAMKDAFHLIVFASKPEYIESTYVYYEWDMFLSAKLKGHKTGNILTVLKGVSPDEITMDLWKYESLPFEKYQENLLNYVETEEAKERWRKLEAQKQKDAEKLKIIEEERQRIENIKQKLISLSEDYKKKETNLAIDAAKIRATLSTLNIETKRCPVCSSECDIADRFCINCGWKFHDLEGVEGIEYLLREHKNSIKQHQKIYKGYSEFQSHQTESQLPDKTIEDLNKTIYALRKDNSDKEKEISQLKRDLIRLTKSEEEKDTSIKVLSAQIEKLKTKNNSNEASSLSKDRDDVKVDDNEYSLWITHSPIVSISIIKECIPGLTFKEWSGINDKHPLCVATFHSKSDAEDLKSKLETSGATCVLKTKNTDMELPADTPISLYGIRIKHHGANKAKVAQTLSKEYSKSVSSLKKELGKLPYKAPATLSKEQAEQLQILLNRLGASAELYQG